MPDHGELGGVFTPYDKIYEGRCDTCDCPTNHRYDKNCDYMIAVCSHPAFDAIERFGLPTSPDIVYRCQGCIASAPKMERLEQWVFTANDTPHNVPHKLELISMPAPWRKRRHNRKPCLFGEDKKTADFGRELNRVLALLRKVKGYLIGDSTGEWELLGGS